MKKGEVWLANLEPARSGELGKTKRPVIIFQNDASFGLIDTVTFIPLSSQTKQYNSIHVLIKPSEQNGLTKDSAAICSHIYTTSTARVLKKIGILSEKDFTEVTNAVLLHLDLSLLKI